MELVNISKLNPTRGMITTYSLSDGMYYYFGAYAYLNVCRTEGDCSNVLIPAFRTVYNANDFNPIRYGNS